MLWWCGDDSVEICTGNHVCFGCGVITKITRYEITLADNLQLVKIATKLSKKIQRLINFIQEVYTYPVTVAIT